MSARRRSLPEIAGSARSTAAGEAGFTLIEVLVGISMLGIVMFALIKPIFVAGNQQGDQGDRIATVDQDRVAFDSMTREIRQAGRVSASGTNGRAIVLTPWVVSGTTTQLSASTVTYSCNTVSPTVTGALECTRTTPSGTTIVIDGVKDSTGNPFFCVQSDPSTSTCLGNAVTGGSYVNVTLQKTPTTATRPFVLNGGVTLRVRG